MTARDPKLPTYVLSAEKLVCVACHGHGTIKEDTHMGLPGRGNDIPCHLCNGRPVIDSPPINAPIKKEHTGTLYRVFVQMIFGNYVVSLPVAILARAQDEYNFQYGLSVVANKHIEKSENGGQTWCKLEPEVPTCAVGKEALADLAVDLARAIENEHHQQASVGGDPRAAYEHTMRVLSRMPFELRHPPAQTETKKP